MKTTNRNSIGLLPLPSRNDYLAYSKEWSDPFPKPIIKEHNGFRVVRDDLLKVGSKSRFADLLVRDCENDHFVYPAPRVGYAAISLAMLCRRYGKKVTLIVPAAEYLSDYHLAAMEYGAEIRTVKIASMPILTIHAKRFAVQVDAEFVPIGVPHILVTSCIVKVALDLAADYGFPKEVWTVAGSGVLSRGLQIAWPDAKFHAIGVGHVLSSEEKGRANLQYYDRPFLAPARVAPPFPCVINYDAKGWEVMQERGSPGALFWNVAGPISTKLDPKNYKSQRKWNDLRGLMPSNKAITA